MSEQQGPPTSPIPPPGFVAPSFESTAVPPSPDQPTPHGPEPTEHSLEEGLRKEWLTIGLLVVSPLVLVVLLVGGEAGGIGLAAGAVVALMLVVAVWALSGAVFERWRYVLWADAIEVRHGVIRHVATFVPFHRIQQVDVERGPLDRAFGIATLVLRTAAATTDAKIPGLNPHVVEDLRQALLERAGIDDAV